MDLIVVGRRVTALGQHVVISLRGLHDAYFVNYKGAQFDLKV